MTALLHSSHKKLITLHGCHARMPKFLSVNAGNSQIERGKGYHAAAIPHSIIKCLAFIKKNERCSVNCIYAKQVAFMLHSKRMPYIFLNGCKAEDPEDSGNQCGSGDCFSDSPLPQL